MGRALLTALLVLSGLLARAQSIAALERRCGGRLGVMAVDTGSGRALAHRADERFAMCSTFKLLLAAMVLDRVDAGKESLDRVLPYGPADLLEHAPVTRSRLGEGGMTMGALCEAALEHSDNTAANLLLAAMGGPEAFTRFARSLGDPVTRLDRCEPALNAPETGKDLDSTSPRAMLEDLRREVLGDGLSAPSRALLQGWLLACATGARSLKAGLPPGWRIGHKTGSGADGATNDIGVLYPPGRPPILVAAYLASGAPPEERDAVLAEVGRLVAAELVP
jgi:beta-lactamase class A